MGTTRSSRKNEITAASQRRSLQSVYPGVKKTHASDKQKKIVVELAPATSLERSIASDIATTDIELNMTRKRKNSILWQRAITPMYGFICKTGAYDNATAKELAIAWAAGSSDAESTILALGIDPEFTHNQAYIENVLLIELIEKQIERLERSRRHLLEDYRRLKLAVKENQSRVLDDTVEAELMTETTDGN